MFIDNDEYILLDDVKTLIKEKLGVELTTKSLYMHCFRGKLPKASPHFKLGNRGLYKKSEVIESIPNLINRL